MGLAMSIHEKEQRIREYKSDETIKMFQHIIFKILIIAKPIIKVCLDDQAKSIFDIEEEYKLAIKYWECKMEEYILTQYPDIITKTSG